jgi:tubulin polyglutamylase TTLL6/13
MFPGIMCISRKNHLARNLMRMYKYYPDEYNFFPKTWVLPNEFTDLRNHVTNTNGRAKTTYIVKPDGLCQGKGIFLSRNFDHIFEVTCN